jgi:hypothetical protein
MEGLCNHPMTFLLKKEWQMVAGVAKQGWKGALHDTKSSQSLVKKSEQVQIFNAIHGPLVRQTVL